MSALEDLQPLLAQVIASQREANRLYLVGGAIRDLLLGRATHDLDFVVERGAIHTARRAADALGGSFYVLDAQRDTGRALVQRGESQPLVLDFATIRGPNLEADLRDRDFTINAIALDLQHQNDLIDPLNGMGDLRAKTIRACSPLSFETDPLRILRGVRQAVQFGFRIEPHTLHLLRAAVPHLGMVSAERLRDELFRMLEGPNPSAALRTLDFLGAASAVLPDVEPLKVNDRWEYTLTEIDRLALLINNLKPEHDPQEAANWAMGLVSIRIGRYRQQFQEHLSQVLNPNRSLTGLLLLAPILVESSIGTPKPLGYLQRRGREMRLSSAEINRLERLVRHHRRLDEISEQIEPAGHPSSRQVYRFFRDTGEAGVDLCMLFLADALASFGAALPEAVWTRRLELVRALLQAWWEARESQISPPLLINGNDLVEDFSLKPGPLVGEVLEMVREAQAAGEITTRENALELVRKWIEDRAGNL